MSGFVSSAPGWTVLSRPGIRSLVGWLLAFLAGTVNTMVTLAILYARASHVTGPLNDVGMYIVISPIDALVVFVIWLSFVVGAFLAGLVFDRIGVVRSLFLLTGGIGIGTFLVWRGICATSPDDYGLSRMIMAFVLPASMGFQNALSSMLPRVGRTTHYTGDSTDIGISLAKKKFNDAGHFMVKIVGYVCGAAASAYMISVRGLSPFYGLTVIAIGYFFTTFFLWWMSLALAES